jgi:putative hydrolase of the HAD superfamily
VTEAVLEEAATHYLDAWTPHIRHEPDAADTLRALRRRGLRIGLLSNTHWPRAFHERFLARDGLAGLIDARLYTSELHVMKPHPQAFRAALDALEVSDPARAVFVGDRPFDDIFGARQAGLRAVLRTNPEVPPSKSTMMFAWSSYFMSLPLPPRAYTAFASRPTMYCTWSAAA